MKFTRILTGALMMITFVVIAPSATAQETENKGFVIDEIIGKIDNYIVLKSDLERAYQDYLTNGGSASPQVRCQYLAMLIRNKLMMAKAEIDSVVVADDEVDQYTQRKMDMIIAQAGVSPDELEERYGKTLEQIRLEIRDQEREQLVVRKMQDEITKGIVVTPAEVKRFFNKIPKDSLPYFSASVEVAQIVRVAKVSESQDNLTRTQLVAIRNQLLSGEDFTTLAKKHSDDPSVTSNGGDMGWSGRGRMVPEYEAMAFRLKPNEISMPFKSPFGFHIMQLLERRGNEYHSRHILISPTPSPQDIAKTTRFLDSIRILIVADSMKFEKAAKEFSDDVPTKGNGGFFADNDGSTKLTVDELDPIVFFKLDSMELGTVSKPIVYRTDDGKQAVRILKYKARIPPHMASLEEDWSRIQAATLNEKKDKILQKWFDKARKDVFISIDPAWDNCGILD